MKRVCGKFYCCWLEDADADRAVAAGIGFTFNDRPERPGKFLTYRVDSAEADILRATIAAAAPVKAAKPAPEPEPVAAPDASADAPKPEKKPAAPADAPKAKRGPGRPRRH